MNKNVDICELFEPGETEIDYAVLSFEVSQDSRFQEIALRKRAVRFGETGDKITTEFGKQMAVMY